METICIALKRPLGEGAGGFNRSLVEGAPVIEGARESGAVAGSLDLVVWPETTRTLEPGGRQRRPMPTDWDGFLQFRFEDGQGRRFVDDGPIDLGVDVDAMAVYAYESKVVAGEPFGVPAGSAKMIALVNRAPGVSPAEAVAHHRGDHVAIAKALGTLYNRYASSGALDPGDDHWDLMVEQWYDTVGRLSSHIRRHSGTNEIKGDEAAFVGWLYMYFASELALWGPA
ncbi:MAG TPA: hypothetical protein VHB02_14775 [Acidimicrobiales bacterium]|nr:hypothetical protein [Acidimicrobiales bacterium]